MICLPSIAKREGCALLQRAPSSAPIALPSQSPTDDSRNNNSANDKNEQHTFIDNTDANNSLNEGNDNNNNIDIKAMLMALGGCVECRNDTIMNTMMITSCMMGPLYGVMRANRDWLGECVCVRACTMEEDWKNHSLILLSPSSICSQEWSHTRRCQLLRRPIIFEYGPGCRTELSRSETVR